MKTHQDLVKAIEERLKRSFQFEATGHDYYHVLRVRNLAMLIQQNEGGCAQKVELAALLHDVFDHKFLNLQHSNPYFIFEDWIHPFGFELAYKKEIFDIIQSVSFSKNKFDENVSLESKIIRDADRLDAIGAIGIARTFAYGAAIKQPIYLDDDKKKVEHPTSIGHFYDKLLKLKEGMHTSTARKIAEERHAFLETFLVQFYKEWKGEY